MSGVWVCDVAVGLLHIQQKQKPSAGRFRWPVNGQEVKLPRNGLHEMVVPHQSEVPGHRTCVLTCLKFQLKSSAAN
jgi:hypothetical protein